jgi:hypothetical protein
MAFICFTFRQYILRIYIMPTTLCLAVLSLIASVLAPQAGTLIPQNPSDLKLAKMHHDQRMRLGQHFDRP